MNAEIAATGTLIERNLPELHHNLVQAGVTLAGLNVGAGHARGSRSGSHGRAKQNATSRLVVANTVEVEPQPQITSSSQVDYRI